MATSANTRQQILVQVGELLKKCKDSTSYQEKLEVTKDIFQIWTSPEGIRIINNYAELKNTISNKLFELSQQGIPTLTREWYRKIFNKEMLRAPLPKENYEKIDNFQRWVDMMTENTKLTRRRKEVLKNVWDILNCITCTRTDQISYKLQEELKDILTSPAAQNMIRGSTHFCQELEREVYEEIDADEYSLARWKGWWPDVFGCDF